LRCRGRFGRIGKAFWIEPEEEEGQQQQARIVLVIANIIIISISSRGHKIT
jgi:hypothetical protein